MADLVYKFKVTENKILKVFHCPEDKNHYDEIWDDVKRNSFTEDFMEDSFILDDKLSYYFYVECDEGFFLKDKLESDFLEKGHYKHYDTILSFEKGTFGENDMGLKGFCDSVTDLINGNIFGYRLVELETCNLGHTHEIELEACWGFYGYKNESDMLLNILGESIGIKNITYFDDLKKWISDSDFLKIKLTGLI